MATPHPRSSLVPYLPPAIVGPMETNPPGYGGGSGGTIATNVLENPKLAGYWDLINAWGKLYPGPVVNVGNLGGPGPIRNSQAIGDRPVTTMTNPLPNYTPPAMVNTPLAQQLRAMINHALAQRGLSPLINTPLPVGATQMGMAR